MMALILCGEKCYNVIAIQTSNSASIHREPGMPEFKKLTNDEVKAIKAKKEAKGPSRRAQVRQQYREYLSQFKPGDWVEVTPGKDEKRQTVKNRLNRAAEDLGYVLRYDRTRGVIRFEVVNKKLI
jgi:hypothetical protein